MPLDENLEQALTRTLTVFGDRLIRLGTLSDPLQAIAETAYLKGSIATLYNFGAVDVLALEEAHTLIDLTLAALLDARPSANPVEQHLSYLLPYLLQAVRGLNDA